MDWSAGSLRVIAPSQTSGRCFSPDETIWHLTLDQIESDTGQIVNKQIKPAREAGNSTYDRCTDLQFDTMVYMHKKCERLHYRRENALVTRIMKLGYSKEDL